MITKILDHWKVEVDEDSGIKLTAYTKGGVILVECKSINPKTARELGKALLAASLKVVDNEKQPH